MTMKTDLPPQMRGMEQDDVQCKSRSPGPAAPVRTRTLGKTPAYAAGNSAAIAKSGSQKRMDARDQCFSLRAKINQNQLLSGVGAKSCLRLTRITLLFMNNGSVNYTARPTVSGWLVMYGETGAQNAHPCSRESSAYSCRYRSRSEYGGQQLLFKAIAALPERHTTMSTDEQTSSNASYSDMLRAAFADIIYGGEGRA